MITADALAADARPDWSEALCERFRKAIRGYALDIDHEDAEALAHEMTHVALDHAKEQSTRKQRIIEMSRQGHRPRDIASLLGISTFQVGSTLSRARKAGELPPSTHWAARINGGQP